MFEKFVAAGMRQKHLFVAVAVTATLSKEALLPRSLAGSEGCILYEAAMHSPVRADLFLLCTWCRLESYHPPNQHS